MMCCEPEIFTTQQPLCTDKGNKPNLSNLFRAGVLVAFPPSFYSRLSRV